MNINVRVISVLSFDGCVYAPQGIFGLGRQERLKGIRILADPGPLSVPWSGSFRLELEHRGNLQGSDALRGWSSEARHRLEAWTWGPALKQGRPLDGGGSCLIWLARGPKEHPVFSEAKPPVPPGLSEGRDTRLCRRGGCSMRGLVKPGDLAVTELCGITAGALRSCSAADWAADAGLSLAITPCRAPKPGRCRLVLRRWLISSGCAGPDTSAIRSSRRRSASICVPSSDLLLVRSLWPSVGRVFNSLPWWRCSLRQGLKGCSIWGCRKEERHINIWF